MKQPPIGFQEMAGVIGRLRLPDVHVSRTGWAVESWLFSHGQPQREAVDAAGTPVVLTPQAGALRAALGERARDTITGGDAPPPGCGFHTLDGAMRLFMWLVPTLSEERATTLAEEAMREMLPTSAQAIRDFIARHAPEGR